MNYLIVVYIRQILRDGNQAMGDSDSVIHGHNMLKLVLLLDNVLTTLKLSLASLIRKSRYTCFLSYNILTIYKIIINKFIVPDISNINTLKSY